MPTRILRSTCCKVGFAALCPEDHPPVSALGDHHGLGPHLGPAAASAERRDLRMTGNPDRIPRLGSPVLRVARVDTERQPANTRLLHPRRSRQARGSGQPNRSSSRCSRLPSAWLVRRFASRVSVLPYLAGRRSIDRLRSSLFLFFASWAACRGGGWRRGASRSTHGSRRATL